MSYNESQEMYLETILLLQSKKGSVHAIDVAMELNYSKPSVSRAVGILKKDGYITVESDGTIQFTNEGREKAIAVFNRHKVLTDAFVKMGMPVAVAEDNACKVEHVISEEAFETIKSYFSEKNMNKLEIF